MANKVTPVPAKAVPPKRSESDRIDGILDLLEKNGISIPRGLR